MNVRFFFSKPNNEGFFNFDAEIIVLQKGNSIAVEYTPASGNTSQEIKVAVTCFFLASEVVDGIN